MPSHLISPPAVQRVAPIPKPLGSPLSHVSVAPQHVVVARSLSSPEKPVLSAAKTSVPAPAHMVSQARTHSY